MISIFRYGAGSRVEFDLADDALVAECEVPRTLPILNIAEATAAALCDPVEYPPLSAATTPADQVVLALEPGVPQVEKIVAEVIHCLVEAGLDPDGLTVLRTSTDVQTARDDPRRDLPDDLRSRVAVVTHEPENRRKMAYLAATGRGDPIFLNRAITDADVVLPIGRVRSPSSPGYHGVHGTIYPTFSDLRAQQRFRSPPATHAGSAYRASLIEQCNEVGWLLGVTFSIVAVPAGGEEVLDVLAGEVQAVGERGRRSYDKAWSCSVPRRASLVIAGIEGGPSQQTWQNVGTSLALAGGLVEEGGAIALCCELSAPPGPAVQQLVGARSRRDAMRHIRKELPEDLLQATQLAEALDRADVYLLSRLDDSMVEDLEMAPISDHAELVRLAHRHRSCILLSNAPHAMVSIEPDAP